MVIFHGELLVITRWYMFVIFVCVFFLANLFCPNFDTWKLLDEIGVPCSRVQQPAEVTIVRNVIF